jgi:hypothetical protein
MLADRTDPIQRPQQFEQRVVRICFPNREREAAGLADILGFDRTATSEIGNTLEEWTWPERTNSPRLGERWLGYMPRRATPNRCRKAARRQQHHDRGIAENHATGISMRRADVDGRYGCSALKSEISYFTRLDESQSYLRFSPAVDSKTAGYHHENAAFWPPKSTCRHSTVACRA